MTQTYLKVNIRPTLPTQRGVVGVVLEVCVHKFWVIQIPKSSTGGQISCDTVILFTTHWGTGAQHMSASDPLRDNVGLDDLAINDPLARNVIPISSSYRFLFSPYMDKSLLRI